MQKDNARKKLAIRKQKVNCVLPQTNRALYYSELALKII
jgi:hypothetical protein